MISFEQFAPEGSLPLYLQIVGFLKRGLVAGTIADGDEMPSRRMLSALLGVNPNTIQKSYAMLEEEGLISSRAGAKSCVVADAEAIGRLRRELLREGLGAVVEEMKQMGMTLAEAHEALGLEWEGVK